MADPLPPFYSQVLWMRRQRVLRRLLVKYRAAGKIDKHLYHELYHSAKGNTFKHKRAIIEHVRSSQPLPMPALRDFFFFSFLFFTLLSAFLAMLTSRFSAVNRSTAPRPKKPARGRSRRRWTPSVPGPRPLASASRNGRRRSGVPWRARARMPRRRSRAEAALAGQFRSWRGPVKRFLQPVWAEDGLEGRALHSESYGFRSSSLTCSRLTTHSLVQEAQVSCSMEGPSLLRCCRLVVSRSHLCWLPPARPIMVLALACDSNMWEGRGLHTTFCYDHGG